MHKEIVRIFETALKKGYVDNNAHCVFLPFSASDSGKIWTELFEPKLLQVMITMYLSNDDIV